MTKLIPKSVKELEAEIGSNTLNKSPYMAIMEFLKKNKGKAYKTTQLKEILNINDYWAVKYACKCLVQDGLVNAYKTNPTWYAWKGS